jgi:hypothetical protein
MVEITLQLPDVDAEGASTEEVLKRYLERAQPLLRQKISELVESQANTFGGDDPFKTSFSDFAGMGQKEQDELRCAALRRYGQWVDAELERRQASWILAIGGRVVSQGSDLATLPTRPAVFRMSEEEGYAPFVFLKEALVEKGHPLLPTSAWSAIGGEDSYPTLSLAFARPEVPDPELGQQGLWLTGDFDTGAPAIFLSQDDVQGCGVSIDDLMPVTQFHLGRAYHYVVPTMKVSVPTQAGALRSGVFQVYQGLGPESVDSGEPATARPGWEKPAPSTRTRNPPGWAQPYFNGREMIPRLAAMPCDPVMEISVRQRSGWGRYARFPTSIRQNSPFLPNRLGNNRQNVSSGM